MATYPVINKETGEEKEVRMSIHDWDQWKTDNPDWESRYVTLKLPKKSIVIFPSNKWHRVRPVTSGIRKALVLWFQGPPFR